MDLHQSNGDDLCLLGRFQHWIQGSAKKRCSVCRMADGRDGGLVCVCGYRQWVFGLIVSNAHLIKKTLFHSHILPVTKVVSCLITHSIFLLVLIGLIVFQKMPFSFYYLQFIYYLFCMTVLALGISWIVSALNVFIRDVGQIVAVVLQMGFWATPIFWDIQMMPSKIQAVFKCNPMYYIVQGYRESFIYFTPFWHHPIQTVYFWCVSITFFITGALIFKKLKPQFPDVL